MNKSEATAVNNRNQLLLQALITTVLQFYLCSCDFNNQVMAAKLGVAKILKEPANPFELFQIWYEEAEKKCGLYKDTMCVASVGKNFKVGNRYLLLRRLHPDGFVVVTDSRSRKCAHFTDNPYVAASFLWMFNDEGSDITKQVRIEGPLEEISRQECREIYKKEPLYCKIRSHICQQDKRTKWEALDENFEAMKEKIQTSDIQLPMPDHFVGYKIKPTMMEFYFAHDQFFADRLNYLYQNNQWKMSRLQA